MEEPTNTLRILVLHNHYQYAGGEDIVVKQEVDLLQEKGHPVHACFRDNKEINTYSIWQHIKIFWQVSWQPDALQKVNEAISIFHPDLLHIHNFFPLFSPAVYTAAEHNVVPVVQHLHNFRLGCLNAYFYRGGSVCEACVSKNPWRGIVYRCYRNSFPASLSIWQMLTVHSLLRTWERKVNAFIAPSIFACKKLVEVGIPEDRLYVKPNFIVDPTSFNFGFIKSSSAAHEKKPYFLFVGRLSPEKGVRVLLQVWNNLYSDSALLKVVGDGPQSAVLKQYCTEKGLGTVRFLGSRSLASVLDLMQGAQAVVVPSQWYETFGRVVVEAFACGRPAIVSDLGALAELVEEGETGFKVSPYDPQAWADRIRWCIDHPVKLEEMGRKARQCYLANYTPEINYRQLMAIYQKVLNS